MGVWAHGWVHGHMGAGVGEMGAGVGAWAGAGVHALGRKCIVWLHERMGARRWWVSVRATANIVWSICNVWCTPGAVISAL